MRSEESLKLWADIYFVVMGASGSPGGYLSLPKAKIKEGNRVLWNKMGLNMPNDILMEEVSVLLSEALKSSGDEK